MKLKPVMHEDYTQILEALYEAGKEDKACICVVEDDSHHHSVYGRIGLGICSYSVRKNWEILRELIEKAIKESPSEDIKRILREGSIDWHQDFIKELQQFIVKLEEMK